MYYLQNAFVLDFVSNFPDHIKILSDDEIHTSIKRIKKKIYLFINYQKLFIKNYIYWKEKIHLYQKETYNCLLEKNILFPFHTGNIINSVQFF